MCHPWLEPLLLGGGKELPDRILPGPMEGITTGAYARVATRRRLTRCWITPFIRISTGVPRKVRLLERLADFLPHESGAPSAGIPLIVQLMGTDIPLLTGTAARLAELGVTGIDLNCACPSKTVVRNGGGGARLAEPAWIRDALLALRGACPQLGISVKLRTGLMDASRELPEILSAVREARPDFVMLHYRTVAEGYRSSPEGWGRLARARELLPDIPLLASGDVFTAADALELWRQTLVDGITPARGLLRNPWLLDDIRTACAGGKTDERGLPARAEFLQDVCVDAVKAKEFSQGFVLELARNLFGAESELFLALTKTSSSWQIIEVLKAFHAGNGDR